MATVKAFWHCNVVRASISNRNVMKNIVSRNSAVARYEGERIMGLASTSSFLGDNVVHNSFCRPFSSDSNKIELIPSFGKRNFKSSVVCMGRRSSKIAMRKGAQDAKKSKLYGKIGKQIVSAVRTGGSSPVSNAALALLLNQARIYDVPKDIIERNIKRATEKGQADFTECNYEIYGVGGVGIVLDVLTDNNARAAANVRDVVKKGGGKMADPGSVMFNFTRCGVVAVKSEGLDPDELMLVAMDSGADDLQSPEEEEGEEEEEKLFKVIAPLESFASVKKEIEDKGFSVNQDESGLVLLPVAFVDPDEEARELNLAMMEKLLELDDVDAVYSNQK